MDISTLYNNLRQCGYEYGESFQGVTALSYNPKDTKMVVGAVHHRLITPPSTLHPTALDAMFQTLLCANAGCGDKTVPTYVPTHIKSLQLLKDGLPDASETFQILAKGDFASSTEVVGSITAFGADSRHPLVLVDGLKCTMLDGVRSSSEVATTGGTICSEIEWKPDVRLLENAAVEDYCRGKLTESASHNLLIELDFVVLARVLETYRLFTLQKKQPAKPYLEKYLQWAAHQKHRLEQNELLYSSEPWKSRLQDWKYIHDVESRLLDKAPITRLPVNVGRNLLDFLTGALDPLEFFFSGTMVDDYYEGTVGTPFIPFSSLVIH